MPAYHSPESERAVLGGLMLDNTLWDQIAGELTADDFQDRKHQEVFSAIISLTAQDKPFDPVTVGDRLEATGKLNMVGGLPYLGELVDRTPGGLNVVAYAATVHEKSQRRKLRDLLQQAVQDTATVPPDDLTGDIAAKVEAITANNGSASHSFAECFTLAINHIEEAAEAKRNGGTAGVPTGLPAIDSRTGGLPKNRLGIVAGRPGLGKTAIANQIAANAAGKEYTVGIISLEMSKEELMLRAMANLYSLNISGLTFGDDRELTKLTHAMGKRDISSLPIHVDTDTYTLGGIVARLAEWKRKHDMQLAIVDHIGLIEGGDNKSRNDWLGTVSRTLKITAKRLNIAILAVSQLNRNVEKDKRVPVLSDLRDSGNIEQDCDYAIFLHNDPEALPTQNGLPIQIGLLKNRMGKTAWLAEQFAFDGAKQRFTQIEKFYPPQ